MLQNPSAKYRPFPAVQLTERRWPDQTITRPPVWMSTDLRDGNQALIEPMSVEKKLRFFDMLVRIGFKEIEVGFPSASQTDFDFVRRLIDEGRIPEDVTIIVLTQARDELIRRTVESAVGARRAIVHLYNSVAPVFRRVVFGLPREEIVRIAVDGTRLVRELIARHPQTDWGFEYSPESFSTTELDFAKHIVDAVSAEWKPTPHKKMIVNLPSTVESATPNVYADQIEWMSRKLERRDCLILSVHPHNDRGTATAAAELALMAGAERVEGCLFGNGERTGNVDIVTLALNLYTQGVHPGLDFSDIDAVRQLVEDCNQLPVHPRHPYAGDLVFTAFSGSHQDAIKKGFAQHQPGALWDIPYLPIDPQDLGRSYDAVIRVNSQSGKGGIAFLLERDYGLALPRLLQIEFSQAIQRITDATGKELSAGEIRAAFDREYILAEEPLAYVDHRAQHAAQGTIELLTARLRVEGRELRLEGRGNGPVDAFVQAVREGMRVDIHVLNYHEHGVGAGED
ncbi:MAG: 2-isopropylmalate synthase, partial [Telluria sp.]